METHNYDLEELSQANAILTRSNLAVMAQLSQITVTMNNMQAQLTILSSASTNQTRTKRNYSCWSWGENYNHGSKTCLANKSDHKEEA